MRAPNQLFLLLVSYSTIFVPAFLTSRIGLIALFRYRAHWLAIVLVHALTLVLVYSLQPWLLPLLLERWKFNTFVSLTTGAVVDTQLLLMAMDLIRPWLAARARENRRGLAARHPTAIGTVLTVASFVIGIGLANWSSRLIDVTEEWLHYQIAETLRHDRNTRTLSAALDQNFPDAFETFVSSYQRSLRPLLSNRSRFQRRFSQLPAQFTRDVSVFVKSRSPDVVRAPDKQLFSVARAQPAMIEQLRAFPLLCATFATGHTDIAREPSDWNQEASEMESETRARFLAANLFAAREGMTHPVERNLGTVRRETALAFRARLQASEAPSIVALASNPRALNVARAEDQCLVALALAKAVAGLPQAQAAELTAYQISHRP